MSPHLQLVLVLWFTSMIEIASSAFVCWVLWSLFWAVYDHLMQQRTRRRNARFDARVGRDCYRDIRGVTR